MSTDYASATINNMTTSGPPGSPAVQPPIGYDRLTGANTEQWNGEIGSDTSVAGKAINAAGVPTDGTSLIAMQGTAGRDEAGAAMTWCLCVAGCSAAATGTITAGAFVAGAGTAVAKAAIPANGFGWVKN